MKTFEQCCHKVAKKRGYRNWSSLGLAYENQGEIVPIHIYQEAAELYASEVTKERDGEIAQFISLFIKMVRKKFMTNIMN